MDNCMAGLEPVYQPPAAGLLAMVRKVAVVDPALTLYGTGILIDRVRSQANN